MAESVAFFSVKSIGLSKVNGRKPCNLLGAARHNLREIQAEQGATGRIDATRMHCNIVLHGPAVAAEVQAQAMALLAGAGIDSDKMRRDHCQAIEAVFSLPPNGTITETVGYFAKCLAWLSDALRLPVLSAVVHRDESAPHLHVLLLPLVGGRHVGGSPIVREALKRLRESFFTHVAGPAGLKRIGAKLHGARKQWAVEAVLRRCEAMGLPEVNGPLWPLLVATIQRNPMPALLALDINPETIRAGAAAAQPTAIGIENEARAGDAEVQPTAMGIENEGQKKQPPSLCRGLPHHTPKTAPLPSAPPAAQADVTTSTWASSAAAVVTPSPRTSTPPSPAPAITTRERDSSKPSGQWCERLGEFLPAPAARPRARTQTDAWVRAALARTGAQARAP